MVGQVQPANQQQLLKRVGADVTCTGTLVGMTQLTGLLANGWEQIRSTLQLGLQM